MTSFTKTESQTPRGIVITGGGSGIGRAAAYAFAEHGDQVLVVGRSAGALAETACNAPNVRTLAVDITAPTAPAEVVDAALRELGRIDVLVNNAGSASFQRIGALDRATVLEQVETNLLAPIFITQQALDALSAVGGLVVNISSAGSIGLRAMPDSSVYAATKVGLDSLTRSWAVELADRGVRVVSIAPGLVNTGVAVRAGMPQAAYDEFLAGMRSRIPTGRVGVPEDIAWWILTLAEPGARYANGALFSIDGGLSLT